MIGPIRHFGPHPNRNCQSQNEWGHGEGRHKWGHGEGRQQCNRQPEDHAMYYGSGKDYIWPDQEDQGNYGSGTGYPAVNNAGNGTPWPDADGDGDADMYLYSDGKVNKDALQKAVQNIEQGSNGKLDIHILDKEPDGSVPGAGYIHVKDLGGNQAGLAGVGNGSDVVIDDKAVDNVKVITHELMHAAGVGQDESVNNGQSIMDYSYQGETLTPYDIALLKSLYGG